MKHTPARAFPAGHFSAPMRAGFPPRFESQIVVDPKTRRMETDFARQQRIRQASGWNTARIELPGSRHG